MCAGFTARQLMISVQGSSRRRAPARLGSCPSTSVRTIRRRRHDTPASRPLAAA